MNEKKYFALHFLSIFLLFYRFLKFIFEQASHTLSVIKAQIHHIINEISLYQLCFKTLFFVIVAL